MNRRDFITSAVATSGALALAGCGRVPNESRRPTSSLSLFTALTLAAAVRAAAPQLKAYTIAETHSMEPVLFGNAVALAEPVTIEDVLVGDIILWAKGVITVPRLHQVYSNDGMRLGVRGANNYRSDNTDTYFITGTELVGRYVGHIVFDPNKR